MTVGQSFVEHLAARTDLAAWEPATTASILDTPDEPERVPVSAAVMMSDRTAAVAEMHAALCDCVCDLEAGCSVPLVDILTRAALVTGERTGNGDAAPVVACTRQSLALTYRGNARRAARLLAAWETWTDNDLRAVVLAGRAAILDALDHETDRDRRTVLELALSLLEVASPLTVAAIVEVLAAVDEPACEHPRRVDRRRRFGRCQQRPRLTHSTRRGDEPHQVTRRTSPVGDHLDIISSPTGGTT